MEDVSPEADPMLAAALRDLAQRRRNRQLEHMGAPDPEPSPSPDDTPGATPDCVDDCIRT